MATQAKLEGNQRYLSKMDDIKIRVPKGKREELRTYAESKNMSLQGLIIQLLEKETGLDL